MAKKRVLSTLLLTALVTIAAFSSLGLIGVRGAPDAYAGQAFVPYDEFSGDRLLPSRWFAKTTVGTNTSGPQILSIGREVTEVGEPFHGVLRLDLRMASAGNGSNVGNNLHFPDSLSIGRIDVVALMAEREFQHGGSNARMRIQMALYNTGGGTPGTNATGDVRAQIYLRGDANAVGIYYEVFQCTNSGCAGSTSLLGTPTQVGSNINLNEAHQLGLSWDGTTLHFFVDNPGAPVASFTTTTDLPGIVRAAPNVKTRFLGSTIRMEGVGGEAHISGGFDDVYVDGVLYDDFNATTCLPASCGASSSSGPMLNPAKWGKGDGSDALELVREARDGALRARTAYSGGAGQGFRNRLFPVNQVATTGLQATVTLNGYQSTDAQVNSRILQITAVNDGTGSPGNQTGDLFGAIRVRSGNGSTPQAQFQVQRCADATCTTSDANPPTFNLGTVNLGTPYVYSLRWTGTRFEYAFYQQGTTPPAPTPYNPTANFPPTPAYTDPVGLNKEIRLAHIDTTAAGGYGYLDVTLDDVHLNPEAAYAPSLAPTYQAQVTGDVVSTGIGLLGAGGGTINLTGVPVGATVVQAFLYATILGDWEPESGPTLNGHSLENGVELGRSDAPNLGYRQAYVVRVDVTNLVTGDGSYVLAGMADGSDGADTLGASLVVVYSQAAAPNRVISINDGAVTLKGAAVQAYETTLGGFTAADPSTGATLTYVVGGGTTGVPEYGGIGQAIYFNGVFSGDDGARWDTPTAPDVSSSLPPGTTSTRAALSTGNDALVWAAAILSVPGTAAGGLYPLVGQDNGEGNVTSNPPGINCGGGGDDCAESYAGGTSVTLTATPNSNALFTGWSGACTGTGPCVVTMDAPKSVVATFTSAPAGSYYVTISKAGTGTGTVTSTPLGIDCGGTCVFAFTSGTGVTLTATPDAGSIFAGWSGDGDCSDGNVTVNYPKSCTAWFTFGGGPTTYVLDVNTTGTGTGTVNSTPDTGISCPTDCGETYNAGSSTTLTATPGPGSYFAGWSGDCAFAGTNPACMVTMSAPKNVTAQFNLNVATSFDLSVVKSGDGTVTSSPPGIDCGATCTANFSSGAVVSLTATPTTPAVFAGWGGACMGSGPCSVTMNTAKTVTAAFANPATPLTGLSAYDEFGSPGLDPGRWGSPREVVREIRGGQLFMAYGATVPAGGRLGQSLNPLGVSSTPSALQTDIVMAFAVPPADGQSRLVITGTFYNDVGGVPTDMVGDVRAQLGIREFSSGDREIFYSVYRCDNADCSVSTDLVPPAQLRPNAQLNQSYRLRIDWTGSAFRFGDGTNLTTVTAPSAINGAPHVLMNALNANIKSNTGGSGYVAGFFDNAIKAIGGAPDELIDAFPGPWIDRSKWNLGDSVREIRSGQLAVQAYASGETSGNGLGFANPGAVTAMAADVTVSTLTFSNPGTPGFGMAGLQGRYYSTEAVPSSINNDVNAEVAYGSDPSGALNLYFQVYRSGQSFFEGLVYHNLTSNIPLGETHRLFLTCDPVTKVLTYGYDGNAWTLDPKPLAAVGNPTPFSPFKGISAGANALAGTTTEFKATYDNVAVNASASPTQTLTTAISGPGSVSDDQIGGINGCTQNCSAAYSTGTVVTLTATPDAGATFTGWSGDCSGTGTCAVTMTHVSSVTATFTLLTPPPAATLVSPTGTIATTTPTYTWNAVASATAYYLWVNDSGASGKVQQWVTATEAGCAAGTGPCSVTPSIALAQGAATWYVQTWNPSGYGPWSSGLGFTVPAGQTPLPATLIAPSGAGIGATPIYTWNAVPGATWYELWVNDSGQARKIDTWYTAAGVGCPAGTGTCVVAPSTPLAPGAATWWIQWWGPSGYGTWSAGMAFTVSQPSTMATLVSPSGTISTSTPTYTWTAVPGMTWYFLWVEDTTGTKVQTWMAASTAGCGSGTGTCTYTPSTAIALGPATWWIQVWSPAGYGPWSDGMSFAVGP